MLILPASGRCNDNAITSASGILMNKFERDSPTGYKRKEKPPPTPPKGEGKERRRKKDLEHELPRINH
jgi:hypothetical protein